MKEITQLIRRIENFSGDYDQFTVLMGRIIQSLPHQNSELAFKSLTEWETMLPPAFTGMQFKSLLSQKIKPKILRDIKTIIYTNRKLSKPHGNRRPKPMLVVQKLNSVSNRKYDPFRDE